MGSADSLLWWMRSRSLTMFYGQLWNRLDIRNHGLCGQSTIVREVQVTDCFTDRCGWKCCNDGYDLFCMCSNPAVNGWLKYSAQWLDLWLCLQLIQWTKTHINKRSCLTYCVLSLVSLNASSKLCFRFFFLIQWMFRATPFNHGMDFTMFTVKQAILKL